MSDYITEFNTNVVVGQFFFILFVCYFSSFLLLLWKYKFMFSQRSRFFVLLVFDFNSYQFECCDRDENGCTFTLFVLKIFAHVQRITIPFTVSFFFLKKVQNLFSQTKCLWKTRQN